MPLSPGVRAWRKAGKHLPDCLRTFHDQKAVFKLMHDMLVEPEGTERAIKVPTWVEGQCYVIDHFLWFMARHGYTLQRSRAKLDFDSLESNLAAMDAYQSAMLARLLSGETAPEVSAQEPTV